MLNWLNLMRRPLGTAGLYIAKTIYRFFGIILFGLLALFAVFDILGELDSVGRNQYTLTQALLFAALQLPARAFDAMPIAVVSSAVVGLSLLASQSEMTVLRVAGLTPKRLLVVMLWIALPFMILTIILGEVVQPVTDKYAAQVKLKALGQNLSVDLSSGAWVRLKEDSGAVSYVNAASISADRSLKNLTIFEFNAQRQLKTWRSAERASYLETPKEGWQLENVTERILLNNVSAQTETKKTAQLFWETQITPAAFAGAEKAPERLHLLTLAQHILFAFKNGVDARKYLSTLLRRLLHPIGLVVMLMLALPFAYLRARGGGVAAKMFAGVLMGIAFHAGNNLFQFLSLVQGWPLWLTMQLPLWLGLAVAGLLFWRFHRLY